jgi:manganese transport protein
LQEGASLGIPYFGFIESNIMALLLQSLSARLGIVTQRDLAQASRNLFAIYQLHSLFFS